VANDSYNESAWESFKPDAARALRAQQGFEDAVARTLDRPFDTSSHGRVEAALEELRAATPGAIRVAELQLGGGA
jgi:hypothetical protein